MTATQPLWLRKEDVPALPEGWTALTTNEACEQLKPGKLYSGKTTVDSGEVPVLSQGESGFVGYHNDSPGVFAAPTKPVVTFANHTCAMRLMRHPYSCIQNIFSKVGKEGLCDTRYFYYAAKGRVSIGDYKGHHPLFRQAYIPIPPMDVQHKIVSVLSTYDDLIENNFRRIEILEEMAQRLYEEWFVHFRFPGHEEVSFKESELGEIPEGWECSSLKEFIELAYGKALKKSERKPGPYPVYGSSGEVGTHSEPLVKGPGIILGRKGNVGSVFWTEDDFYPIDTVYYVKTDLPLEYVFFNLQRQRFLNNDAAVPGLNRNQAYSLPFLKPSETVLEEFSRHCKPIYELVRKLHRKNTNLRAQRDLLLPKLVSGEIDVSDMPMPEDKEVEAA